MDYTLSQKSEPLYYSSVIYSEDDTDYLAFKISDEDTVVIVGDIVADGYDFTFSNCSVYSIHHDYGGISQQNRNITVESNVSGVVSGSSDYNLYAVSSVGIARRNEYYEIAESRSIRSSVVIYGIFIATLLCVVALFRRKK